MLLIYLQNKVVNFLLIEQTSMIKMLIVVIAFFFIILVLGVRKSFKLKAENERLSKQSNLSSSDDNKTYKDFREGHLYDNC